MARPKTVIGEEGKRPSKESARERPFPPGRIKIANAFVSLLEQKEFSSITTAEIAKKAGVTEALIYKYFEDKRGLLHQVLKEYLEQYLVQFERDLKGIKGALNKIRKLIWGHISVIIEEGVRNGEIRGDVPPKLIRQVIFGSIEHVCLTGVIFKGEISPDDLTEDLCRFIFKGIEPPAS